LALATEPVACVASRVRVKSARRRARTGGERRVRKRRGLLVRYGGSGTDVVGRGGRSFDDASGGLERRVRRGGERDESSLDLEEKSDRREEGSMVAGRAGF
jgi:hypothetical protein